MHASRPQYQIAGDSTGSQRPEAELRTAASTKARPLTPSSTVGNARSTWSGDLRHTLRSEEHTSELQSHSDLVCRLLLEKKTIITIETARPAAELTRPATGGTG